MQNIMALANTQTMTSVELTEVINNIREQEGSSAIEHSDLMRRIKRLIPILGLSSVAEDKYLSSINQEQPMFRLDNRTLTISMKTIS